MSRGYIFAHNCLYCRVQPVLWSSTSISLQMAGPFCAFPKSRSESRGRGYRGSLLHSACSGPVMRSSRLTPAAAVILTGIAKNASEKGSNYRRALRTVYPYLRLVKPPITGSTKVQVYPLSEKKPMLAWLPTLYQALSCKYLSRRFFAPMTRIQVPPLLQLNDAVPDYD